tara:strand:+ start:1074 stop:1538 length:465 start_codon:yes stop_codon:yes gene_type:complete
MPKSDTTLDTVDTVDAVDTLAAEAQTPSMETRLLEQARTYTNDPELRYTSITCDLKDKYISLVRMRPGESGSVIMLSQVLNKLIPLAEVTVVESLIDGCQEVVARIPAGATAERYARKFAGRGVVGALAFLSNILAVSALCIYALQYVDTREEL